MSYREPSACVPDRAYPDDARHHVWPRPGGFYRYNKPLVYVARTVPRPSGKTRPSRRSCSLRNQRVDQEDQDKPKEQDITKGKSSLAGQASLARSKPPQGQIPRLRPQELSGPRRPASPPRLHRSTSQQHRSLIGAVSSPQVDKWLSFGTWQPFLRKITPK
jgi:hypothetical protein